MRPRQWRLRVTDMLDAVAAIQTYTAGMDLVQFEADRRTVDAVLRNVEIIGEAISALPDELKARHPEVPWRDIRNMRNFLTHVYFGIDLARVWQVVECDVGVLADQLRALLAAEGED